MGKFKKPLVVALAVILLAGLAVGGFFVYKKVTKKTPKQEQAKTQQVVDDVSSFKQTIDSQNNTVTDQIKNGTYKYAADTVPAVIALARNQTLNKQYDDALKTLAVIPELKGEQNITTMILLYEAKINVYKFSGNQAEYAKAKNAYISYLSQFKTNQQAIDTKKNIDKLFPANITVVASGDEEN